MVSLFCAIEVAIARSCGLAASTVGDHVKRAEAAGLTWPLPESMTEEELTKQLFGSGLKAPSPSQPLPDWLYIHQELHRKSVTLQLLWEEYRHWQIAQSLSSVKIVQRSFPPTV